MLMTPRNVITMAPGKAAPESPKDSDQCRASGSVTAESYVGKEKHWGTFTQRLLKQLLKQEINRQTKLARKLQHWPELEAAVDARLGEQAAFVAQWETAVWQNDRPGTVPLPGQLSVAAAEAAWNISKETVLRWRTLLQVPKAYRARIARGAYIAAGLEPPINHRAERNGEYEWFTPAEYIEAARAVMGGIDVDPASHPVAQFKVRAERFHTAADDGLAQQWIGRVWLHPPHAKELIGRFVDKLIDEHRAGRTTEAVLLTHNYTDTAWFHTAETHARLICFTRGRITFLDPIGAARGPTHGQAFFYFGPNSTRFAETFAPFGFIR